MDRCFYDVLHFVSVVVLFSVTLSSTHRIDGKKAGAEIVSTHPRELETRLEQDSHNPVQSCISKSLNVFLHIVLLLRHFFHVGIHL